jgi:hypothetical protein
MTSEVLDRGAEYDAAVALPPCTAREPIEALNISRELAQEQHTMLLAHLEELEAAWEQRS